MAEPSSPAPMTRMDLLSDMMEMNNARILAQSEN